MITTATTSSLGVVTARPATYVRQSSARANKSEASPETQRAATGERAAHDHPGAEIRRFEDIGKSGWDPDVKREGYDALMTAVALGQVTHVYVYYMSRLTRDEPQSVLIDWLPLLKTGVTIISTTEGTFGTGDLGSFIGLIIKLSESHGQSQNKSDAIKGAKALAHEAGGHVGQPPYGFATEERIAQTPGGKPVAIRALVVVPSEGRALRVAARAVRWGFAVHAVVRHFERRGILTRGARIARSRASSAWSDRSLGMRLRDPRIAGLAAVLVLDAQGNTAGYHVATGVPGERTLPAPDEAILTADEFWALQSALNGRVRTPMRRGDRPALLSRLGIVYCECGRPMKSRRFGKSPSRDAYMCPAPAGRHSCTISMAALDAWVPYRIGRLIESIDPADPDQEAVTVLAEASRRYARANVDPAAAARRDALAAELADASASLDRIGETLATATGAAARVVARQVTAAGARVDALTAALTEVDQLASPTVPLVGWTSSEYGDEGTWWDGASVADRQEFLWLFIDRITVRRAPSKGGRPPRNDLWAMLTPRVTLEWARAQE